jgi:hypothetical protein
MSRLPHRPFALAALALAAAVSPAAPIGAQTLDPSFEAPRAARPSRTFVGIQGLVMQPLGEFDRNVGFGGGVAGHIVQKLDPEGVFALRADLGFIVYGIEHRRIDELCDDPACDLIDARVETNHSIFFGGIGPQIMAPSGQVRPYVRGAVGFSYFSTNSSLEGADSRDENILTTRNFDDGAFSWSGGGGLYIPVRRGPKPINIDLGASYFGTAEASYLHEGSIQEVDGRLRWSPTNSAANQVLYHIGVSVGL